MGKTDIPYCDMTWDLSIGCRKRSPGCDHCWATNTVYRLACKGVHGYGAEMEAKREHQTNWDQVDSEGRNWLLPPAVNLFRWNLVQPLGWRKPQVIFVNSKSDLFDERVPFELIAAAFDVMARCRWHRFLVLTKEPERMVEFITDYAALGRQRQVGVAWPEDFPHVALAVSVEGPQYLGRVEILLATPAMMRLVSFEPLLEPVAAEFRALLQANLGSGMGTRIDGIILGCEKRLGGSAGRWAGEEPEAWWGAAALLAQVCSKTEPPIAVWVKQGPVVRKDRIIVSNAVADFPSNCGRQEFPKGMQVPSKMERIQQCCASVKTIRSCGPVRDRSRSRPGAVST